jgi:hypothetical protein
MKARCAISNETVNPIPARKPSGMKSKIVSGRRSFGAKSLLAITAAIEIPTTFPTARPKKIPENTGCESPAIVGMTTATAVKANMGKIKKLVAG